MDIDSSPAQLQTALIQPETRQNSTLPTYREPLAPLDPSAANSTRPRGRDRPKGSKNKKPKTVNIEIDAGENDLPIFMHSIDQNQLFHRIPIVRPTRRVHEVEVAQKVPKQEAQKQPTFEIVEIDAGENDLPVLMHSIDQNSLLTAFRS